MALSTTGVESYRGGSVEKRVIGSFWTNGLNVKCYDACTTVTTAYCGMDEASAKAKAAALVSFDMSDYRIRSSTTYPYAWMCCPAAKGTSTTASVAREGNSRMFTVTAVTETHVCSNSAGWTEF